MEQTTTPIDSPAISFKDEQLLLKQCEDYLQTLHIPKSVVRRAFKKAQEAQNNYLHVIAEQNRVALFKAKMQGELAILLAGRPYHTDALIQHKVSGMLAEMGIHVLTEDIVRSESTDITDVHFLAQWSYPNRIMRAAKWCAEQDNNIQFVQMTSFGCGPDAFIVDEVREVLLRHHKAYTLLKLDDINNIGSMKLRVRSLVESLKLAKSETKKDKIPFTSTPIYDHNYRHRKIIVPFFTSFISPLIPAILQVAGYDAEGLPMSDEQSAEWGLKYANNEVCYPATLVIGDIIKAFKEGQYNPSEVVVAITQTGGQCRASNYFPMLKKALIDAGYTDTPVISLTFGDNLDNHQPAFKVDWKRLLPIALRSIVYSDCINKMYHASIAREKTQSAANKLRNKYLQLGSELIKTEKSKELYKQLHTAAQEFNDICYDIQLPRVGVVGEIYLKFNSFAQRNIVEWLTEQHIEVVPPVLTEFFVQSFVNRKARTEAHIEKRNLADAFLSLAYRLVHNEIQRANKLCAAFKYFKPFGDIYHEAHLAERVITLNAQFGEGWLLPAEIMSYAENGTNSIISFQPFGCIANHIVARGIEKKIKKLYPSINLLSLDFDSGVSDVNIKNRLLLFVDKLKQSK